MAAQLQIAVQKTNELRDQYIDHAFRKELEDALFSHRTISHPIVQELARPVKNLELMRFIALQGYHLTRNFARYIGGLYNNCEVGYYRKRLAINLYEEETGMLSRTANHEVLMQRFLRALGISDEERDSAPALATTTDLIDYRWNLVEKPETFHMGASAVMIASEGQNLEEEAGKARHELLPQLYGFKPEDLSFFSVHAHEDIFHVREGLDLVSEICDSRKKKDEALEAIHETCARFWRFYDGIQEAYRG
ncbi:MAG: iron-containing redox enzyme family protein [Gammaproteobacteria bacterium]|nr:iron-containing redox enzyme family protein [Gammaproteobacteria bacterium]